MDDFRFGVWNSISKETIKKTLSKCKTDKSVLNIIILSKKINIKKETETTWTGPHKRQPDINMNNNFCDWNMQMN